MSSVLNLLMVFFLLCASGYAAELELGAPLTLTKITKVSMINAHPEKYVGKRVVIEGLVISVCTKQGCWMDIASDVPFDKIQVKVVDGEIVFPMEAKGRMAKVEGVVEEMKLSQEQAIAFSRQLAEEQGQPFDPATITGPMTYYRVRGLGAVIE